MRHIFHFLTCLFILTFSCQGSEKLAHKVFIIPTNLGELDMANQSPFWAGITKAKKKLNRGSWPTIAILDSGIDREMAAKEGVAIKSSLLHEINFTDSPDDDDLGHGTAIALTLAAKQNGFGIIGLLPEVPILAVKVGTKIELEKGNVPFERIRRAVEAATKQGAKIIAMSLSNNERLWPKSQMQALLDEYKDKVLFIAAAGNDGMRLDLESHCPFVPICNSAKNLMIIGAEDYKYSNHGNPINLSVRSKCYHWNLVKINGLDRIYELRSTASTSNAVPNVAALAALVMKACTNCNPTKVRELILEEYKRNPRIVPLSLVQRAQSEATKTR